MVCDVMKLFTRSGDGLVTVSECVLYERPGRTTITCRAVVAVSATDDVMQQTRRERRRLRRHRLAAGEQQLSLTCAVAQWRLQADRPNVLSDKVSFQDRPRTQAYPLSLRTEGWPAIRRVTAIG